MTDTPQGLKITHLRFTVEAQNRVEFGPQAGAQIRGALYNALRSQSCTAPNGRHDPIQAQHCPVCWLMAREDRGADRGKDVPRAFTVRPPLDTNQRYVAGQRFSFGITLFGKAIDLFPYIVLALPLAGQQGIGYGRGRVVLHCIEAIQPLTGKSEVLMPPGTSTVQTPTLSVTADQVKVRAATLSPERLMLHFLTPTRLTEDRHLVKTPVFHTIIARLLERYDTLNREYGDNLERTPWVTLTNLASDIRLVQDQTQWVEVFSGSRRTMSLTPLSGFFGKAIYSGELEPFREWLLWGQSIQIGKDTVKGNGLYQVSEVGGWESFNI